jgi:gamma-glutamyltranspeptidase/glutathione hydrolase
MKRPVLLIILLVWQLSGFTQRTVSVVGPGKAVDPYYYPIVKSQTFNQVSVASAHPLASEIGAEIMRQGGNAFDAAIATQLALAVIYPGAGNIGGGGFLVGRKADGTAFSIDFRETAPAKSSRDMYLDKNGNAQTQLSQTGRLASGVPGTVAGLFATLPYARLPFKTLIQPAIDLAEYGFVLSEREAKGLNSARESFIRYSSKPSALSGRDAWEKGDTLIQKELAETLKRIRDNGQKGFYEGKTAAMIVKEMKQGNGIISLEDLKNYTAKKRNVLQFDYRGYTILTMPPPSSGGLILCQLMKMAAQKPMSAYGFQSIQAVQFMIEAERRSFADRAEYMGDPDFWKVPVKTLTSDTYLTKRIADYDSTRATPSKNIQAGSILKESEETTHISIIDQEGNMVTLTTTLNGSYGSRTIVGGAGFLLNNEMDDFSVKPGVPNMYGAVGGEANAISPGKRMLSSMTPTLVLKNKKPYIVAGTPGGTTIPTSVFQTLINILDFDMNASDAVNQPKFHHQWLPDEVMVENDFPAVIKKQLVAMGYKITEREAIGRTEVIKILGNGKREVAADKRGDDSVSGY